MRYKADITLGSLKIPESRIIADLLLQEVDSKRWQKEIIDNNILQTRSPNTAKRMANFIRSRLILMKPGLWRMIRDEVLTVSTQAVLAAAVKHSSLLGDFLDFTIREHLRLFNPSLSNRAWDEYLGDCRGRDPEMPEWSDSTKARLRSSVFQILSQAGYIDSVKSKNLQTVHISSQVIRYLEENNEKYVLRCIQVAS